MALLSALVKAIADVEGLDEVQVGWIARHLREAGLISQAGRGRGAARMTARDAVNLLIAVNGSSGAKQAVDAVKSFSDLILVSNGDFIGNDNWVADLDVNDDIERAFTKGTSLPSSIEAILLAHIPNNDGVIIANNMAEFTIDFVRPVIECEILFGSFSNLHDQEIYQQAQFRNLYSLGQKMVQPDKVDSTIISSRTLEAVGKVLAT